MPPDGAVWPWFHRVLVGTFVEGLVEAGIAVDAATIALRFDDGCVFQFPALDNHLHFVGVVTAELVSGVEAAGLDELRSSFEPAWPALVKELRRFPLPDRLRVTRNEVALSIEGSTLALAFDLEAD
jgi:hypothetical protein